MTTDTKRCTPRTLLSTRGMSGEPHHTTSTSRLTTAQFPPALGSNAPARAFASIADHRVVLDTARGTTRNRSVDPPQTPSGRA